MDAADEVAADAADEVAVDVADGVAEGVAAGSAVDSAEMGLVGSAGGARMAAVEDDAEDSAATPGLAARNATRREVAG